MELSDKIKFCAICKNSKRDMQRGIVCGLTNEKPTFDEHCDNLQASPEDLSALEGKNQVSQKKNNLKLFIALFLILFVGIAFIFNKKQTSQTQTKRTDNHEAISAIVDSINSTLPTKLNNYESLDSITLTKRTVKKYISITGKSIQEYADNNDKRICEAKWRHCERLKNLKNENREFLQLCLKDSMDLHYTYFINTSIHLYTIVLHPDDISNALESNSPFRCSHADFDRVLKSENLFLPFDVVSKIQMSSIKFDYGTNTLKILLRSRRSGISSESDYEKIVKTEIWKEMEENYAVMMAMLNEGTIDFRFVDTNDKLLYSFPLGTDFYSK